ncbi:MAG: phage virion morphogenesis protein [Sporomusaceae bacterium]|jgi:phage gpG-like protein|nr:phage virion morphogenesis protein [Sporomusaceae bacterium]
MVEVRFTTPDLKALEIFLGKMVERGAKLKPVLRKIGVVLEGITDRNFEAQGRPIKWRKRSPVTTANLVWGAKNKAKATKKYQNAKKAKTKDSILRHEALRHKSNLILHQSGVLKQSITSIADDKTVRIGALKHVKYARIHQFGGVIRPKNKTYLFVPFGKKVLRLKKVIIPARPYLIVPPSEMPGLTRAALEAFTKELIGGIRL